MMRRAPRRSAAPVLAFAVLAFVVPTLAACWSDRPADPGDRRPVAAEVAMTGDLEFAPASVTVAVGGTVRWINESPVIHTVTADPDLAADPANVELPPGAQTFHSGDVSPGTSYERTFTVAGRYLYVCLPHETAGMTGTVVVE